MRFARIAISIAPAVLLLAACSSGSSEPSGALAVEDLQAQLAEGLASQNGYDVAEVSVVCDGGIDNVVGATQECEATGPAGAAHLSVVVDAAEDSGPAVSWSVSESSAPAS